MSLSATSSNFIYSLYRYTNRNNFIIEDNSKEPFHHLQSYSHKNIELVQLPEIVEKEKRGSCYDQTFLVKRILDEERIKSRLFYSIVDDIPFDEESGLFYYDAKSSLICSFYAF